jgi:hypothetical protein
MKNRTSNFREIQILSDAESLARGGVRKQTWTSTVPKGCFSRDRYPLKSTAAERSLTASASSTFTPGERPIIAEKLRRCGE